MLGAIFTSLSGMNAFRSGLDTISNNVANMNTPGFKLSDPLFRDLVYQHGGETQPKGAGVYAGVPAPSFQQGELRETGNSLDAAIDGAGLFVLEQDGRRVYTRAGQFEFDKDGILVERGSGARVLVNTSTSSLTHFDLNEVRVFAPRGTTEVTLSGVLMRSSSATAHTLSQIAVIDAAGASHQLSARFSPDSADQLHWTVEILDDDNTVLGSGDLRFNADGTPADGGAVLSVTVTLDDVAPFDVAFDFGTPGRHNGITSITGTTTSQVRVLSQNGVQLGTITRTEFDERGHLKIIYSNGESTTPATLVLAQFDTPDQLEALGDSRYGSVNGREPAFGSALSFGLGRIAGGKLEMSNVDLTNQFTDLIIAQRGFQGSSQIASVANEMIQQLLSMNGNR